MSSARCGGGANAEKHKGSMSRANKFFSIFAFEPGVSFFASFFSMAPNNAVDCSNLTISLSFT